MKFGAADVLVLVGLGSLGTGLWMLSPAVCLVGMGVVATVLGLALARREAGPRDDA